jgi:ABC-2 type transport system permease protein
MAVPTAHPTTPGLRPGVASALDSLRLYGRYVSASFRSQMQYRASFIMTTVAHFLMTVLEFLGILALFDRFGQLQGWQLPEVAVFYGVVNMAFAICDATSRGFDIFHAMVRTGDFDRLLLRPRSTVLQLAGQELTLRRVGRLSQGALVLGWGLHTLGAPLSWPQILLLIAAVTGGALLFYGIIVLQATLAFWTTESLEIMNTMTYGGVQTAQYPLSIYRDWFRRLFTYVVPLAAVAYFPTLVIIGRTDPLGSPAWVGYISPVVGPLFFLASLRVWRFGVRHYRSTGS